MAQLNPKQPVNQNFGVGTSHSRSLSQPTFFANSCLPPLSPYPHSEASFASANSSVKEVAMEEVDVSSRSQQIVASFTRDNVFRGTDSLPPRNGHRRSNSDIPLGFSAMIQSSPQLVPISGQGSLHRPSYGPGSYGNEKSVYLHKEVMDVHNRKTNAEQTGEKKMGGEVVDELFCPYMNIDSMDVLNSDMDKDKETFVSGSKISGGDSSNTESESNSKSTTSKEGVKRTAAGDIAPTARHFRSLSMDSAFGNISFGDESPKLKNSIDNRAVQLSPSNSVNENSTKFSLDFGNGEFSETELKKIMADERLAEIAMSDPKRAKRIVANRQSAARSKERKLRYISELEHKVQTLQTEATTLSAKLTVMQKDFTELTSQNSELKFRLQAMEQQAQLRDALHEALTAEVQRLKLTSGELREEGRLPSCMAQQMPMKHHMLKMHRQQASQIQQVSAATSTTATTASATPASA